MGRTNCANCTGGAQLGVALRFRVALTNQEFVPRKYLLCKLRGNLTVYWRMADARAT